MKGSYFVWFPTSFLSAAQIAIDSFAEMQDGWHYGSGLAPDANTRRRASVALERMQTLGLRDIQAFPGADGEILLSATRGDDYFSATIERNGLYAFNHEHADEEVFYREGLSLGEFIGVITEAIGGVWHTSGSLAHGGLITKDASSMTWLSKSPPTAECQYFLMTAPLQQVA